MSAVTSTEHNNQTWNKPVLAVINPHSGSGNSMKLFRKIVEPIWKKKQIHYVILKTEYAGHCTTVLASDKNVTRYKSIIAVGGDGTLAEVINGLKANPWVKNAEKIISLGIIPVGSGNGLAKSMHVYAKRKYTIKEAAKMTASVATRGLDLLTITQKGQSRIGFLAITLGLIADIDILTEQWRYLGNFRYTLGAIMGIWKKKVYPAQLSYLPHDSKTELNSISYPNDLKKLSGNFTLIMAGNTTHCSSNALVAPEAKPDDGYLHVTAVREVSSWKMLMLLLKLESGNWVKDPSVITFKTKFLQIEGLSQNTILTVDGERIPPQPIQCRVHQAALQILCS